jgi:hypothetical protein
VPLHIDSIMCRIDAKLDDLRGRQKRWTAENGTRDWS